jgi:hypothetical protein
MGGNLRAQPSLSSIIVGDPSKAEEKSETHVMSYRRVVSYHINPSTANSLILTQRSKQASNRSLNLDTHPLAKPPAPTGARRRRDMCCVCCSNAVCCAVAELPRLYPLPPNSDLTCTSSSSSSLMSMGTSPSSSMSTSTSRPESMSMFMSPSVGSGLMYVPP